MKKTTVTAFSSGVSCFSVGKGGEQIPQKVGHNSREGKESKPDDTYKLLDSDPQFATYSDHALKMAIEHPGMEEGAIG